MIEDEGLMVVCMIIGHLKRSYCYLWMTLSSRYLPCTTKPCMERARYASSRFGNKIAASPLLRSPVNPSLTLPLTKLNLLKIYSISQLLRE